MPYSRDKLVPTMEDVYQGNPEEEQRREQDRVDLQEVMRYAWGRRVVWRQLERAGVFRSSFQGEAAYATAFNEGQRNIGLMLIADLQDACPELYAKMQLENTTP